MKYTVNTNEHSFILDTEELETMDIQQISENEFHLIDNDKGFSCKIHSIDLKNKKITLALNDEMYVIEVSTPLDMLIKEMGMNTIQSNALKEVKAPMPGLILEILVEEGQKVEKDDSLVILEAMKMENILKAEGEGIIKDIRMKKGDSVEKHQVLIELE